MAVEVYTTLITAFSTVLVAVIGVYGGVLARKINKRNLDDAEIGLLREKRDSIWKTHYKLRDEINLAFMFAYASGNDREKIHGLALELVESEKKAYVEAEAITKDIEKIYKQQGRRR